MPRVLIVDDDLSYLILLARLCTSCGAEAVTAETADEARAALASGPFDLLMVDLQLTGHDGIDLINEIERQPELAKKAIVVTGFATIAPGFTSLPIVDKSRLQDLGVHLKRMLGRTD